MIKRVIFPISLLMFLSIGSGLIRAQSQPLSVVINEVMFAPVKPEPEWIELLNTTGDTIDIAGWVVSVHDHTPVSIPDSNALLAPDSMVILTSNDTELASYRDIPLDRIIRMSIPDLSNTGSTISLRDSMGNLIDSMYYDGTWIKADGISIERIDPFSLGYVSSNWGASKDSSGCTILRPNSIRERAYDLALLDPVVSNRSIVLSLVNEGVDTVRRTTIGVQIGSFAPSFDTISTNLASHDTLLITVMAPSDFYGVIPVTTYTIDTLDEAFSNDTLHFNIRPAIPFDSLVINEIMFDPLPASCQWMEVDNISEAWISLDSLKLLTGESKPAEYSHVIPALLIPPDSFGVIAANDSIFSTYPRLAGRNGIVSLNTSTLDLGKDSSFVVLRNPDSITVDSVPYKKNWQQSLLRSTFAGISLERKNPRASSTDPNNWQACLDTAGATPLEQNSLDTSTVSGNTPATSTVFQSSFSPNPFSPTADATPTTLTVQTGNATQWALRVRIYDAHGRMVRLLTDATSVYRAISLSFDGKRDNGQTLTPGLYTALVELTSQSPLETLKQIIGIVVAGKRK